MSARRTLGKLSAAFMLATSLVLGVTAYQQAHSTDASDARVNAAAAAMFGVAGALEIALLRRGR